MIEMRTLYGLKMSAEEYMEFARVYCRMHGIAPSEKEIDKLTHRDNGNTGHPFKVVELAPDYLDYSLRFWSFGDRSAEAEEIYKGLCEDCDSWYVITCKKPLDSFDSFFGQPAYRSFDELVQEFKGELERYLPSDFNYAAHIGKVQYAYRTKHVRLIISDIEWDLDDDMTEDMDLPTSVELTSCRELGDVEECSLYDIADHLSDKYGFCINNFTANLKTDM